MVEHGLSAQALPTITMPVSLAIDRITSLAEFFVRAPLCWLSLFWNRCRQRSAEDLPCRGPG